MPFGVVTADHVELPAWSAAVDVDPRDAGILVDLHPWSNRDGGDTQLIRPLRSLSRSPSRAFAIR